MNLGVRQQLNYDLYTNIERADQVRSLFTPEVNSIASANFEQASTQAELELCANFILYGKDPETGKNCCQTKEIDIEQSHAAYRRKQPESLDALMEEEHFRETEQLQPVQKNIYKKFKPTINRETDKDIPGMQDLGDVIDKLAKEVKECKENKQLGLRYYQANHLLIALRKEQYVLKDIANGGQEFKSPHAPTPTLPTLYSDTGYLVDYKVEVEYNRFLIDKLTREGYAPEIIKDMEKRLEAAQSKLDQGIEGDWIELSQGAVDLTNPNHVYELLEMYGTLRENSFEDLYGDTKFLLGELEDCIEAANLNEIRMHVLIRKIDKVANSIIAKELNEMFGVTYAENYISTIYKRHICGKIAAAAQLRLDSYNWRHRDELFKTCSCCGRRLLMDTRNFVKKSTSPDGFECRCKRCDKKAKTEAKHK